MNLLGERRREHESLPFAGLGHRVALDDLSYLGLEAHVQHAVSFVEYEMSAVVERHAAAVQHVHEAARRRDQQVAAAVQLAELVLDRGTAVSVMNIPYILIYIHRRPHRRI